MRTKIRLGKVTLVRRSYNGHPPFIWEFTDADGAKRRIVDEDRNVQRIVEAAKSGSGKEPQSNVTIDNTHTGLPPTNLQPVMGGEGRAQWSAGTFLDGDGSDNDSGPHTVFVKATL